MDDDQLLQTAMRAARAGGQLAREHLGRPDRVTWKKSRDIVTPSMLQVQAAIIDNIRSDFPDHAILSEELAEAPDPDAELLWQIDPIDGSLNYMRGIPFFSVAVGFRYQGQHRLGVVYDPCRDELFHGIERQGAFLNGRRIRVKTFAEGLDAFQAATVGTDWPAHADKRVTNALIIRQIAGEVVSLQVLGSPALGLCYIAAGRLDAYFHLQLQPWDVAAAAVILEEGGGVLTNAEGGTWQFSDGGYLATNGIIHGWMLSPIRVAREQDTMLAARQRKASP